ncbi:MAG: ASCH domain-containing protein [Nanoarchaeota archaeon]|nr:ASCH domain-containing protein [Nanoarchaeota archaeon]
MTRVLHLSLHRQWFDEIANGTKTTEFRTIKPYWTKRLEGRIFDEVWFKNGYAKDAPFMRVEWKGLILTSYHGEKKYGIKLGAILELKHYPLDLNSSKK